MAPIQLNGQVQWKQDPNFGLMAVYHKQLSALVGLGQFQASTAEHIQVTLRYQRCADTGLCFTPVDRVFNIPVAANLQALQVTTNTADSPAITAIDLKSIAIPPML